MRLTRRTPPSRASRHSRALAEAGVLMVLALAVTLAACSGESSDPSAGPGDGDPGTSELAECADLVGAQLGWDASRREREIREVRERIPFRRT